MRYISDLHFQVNVALSLAIRRVVYIDTVQILLPRSFSEAEYSELQYLSHPYAVRLEPRQRFNDYPARLRLHRPTLRAIYFITEIVPSHILSRVDPAFDILTADQPSADRVGMILRLHLTEKWRAESKSTHQVRTTFYSAGPWQGRTMALYTDRPSKVTGNYCCHTDFRYVGVVVRRTIGITKLDDLRYWDPILYIKRHNRLSAINWDDLAAHLGARRYSILARSLGVTPTNLPSIPAQKLIDETRGHAAYDLSRFVTHVPLAALLDGAEYIPLDNDGPRARV